MEDQLENENWATGFEYAADHITPGDFTEQFRFPVVTSPFPRWAYVTAVAVCDQPWRFVRPTNDELLVIASFHEEYCDYWYGPAGAGYRATMESKYPFDIDGGANTRILVKRGEGDWAYRRRTWDRGPMLVPALHMEQEKLDLIPLLDRIQTLCDEVRPRWTQWKAERPELFGAVAS